MLNPEFKIARSKGIDIPTMYIYLVGKISGNCMEQCLSWRKQIIDHYRNYKPVYGQVYNGAWDLIGETKIVSYESYPISFMCPLNSGESKTADNLGLKSHLSKNLIYDKDILSLHKADAIVANLDDFMEVGIEDYLIPQHPTAFDEAYTEPPNFDYIKAYNVLKETIINRRANLGSHFEVSVSLYLRKPVILIAGNERNKYILENHPFFSRASIVVLDTDQLLKEKWIQTLYKSMAGSTGEY